MALNFYRSDLWVKLVSGQAVSGAQVYVLKQPANVIPPITPPRTIPVPFVPNPQVQVYSDAGFTPVSQPVLTDGFGHADFYVLPGVYTVAIFFGGKLQQFYIDQSIGNVGSSGGTSLLLEVNGSPVFNQTVLNLQQGAGIALTPDNFGNVTITNTGSGSGTVTHTSGPLTLNSVLLGNGAADIKAGAVLPGDATKFYDGTGTFSVPAGGGGSSAFGSITSGTNSTATMVVNTGASLTVTGSGLIQSTKVQGVTISGTPPLLGQVLSATSPTTADWETVSGSSGMPTPNIKRVAFWEAGSLAGFFPFIATNDGANTLFPGGYHGTIVPPSATAGYSISFANVGGLENLGVPFCSPLRDITFQTTVQLNKSGEIFYTGLSSLDFEALIAGPITDPTTVDSMLIASDTSATWKLVCTKAGVKTTVDTTKAIDTNRHVIELTLISGVATCFFDGVSVATCITNLPTHGLGGVWYLPAGTGTLNSVFEYAYITNPTP
jgi:hypothetical protein